MKEIWTEVPKSGKGKKKARVVNRDRFISKVNLLIGLFYISLFLRGDSVVIVCSNPNLKG